MAGHHGTEVTEHKDPMQEFQDKLKAKVREEIADLLPDEAVQRLVESAVRDTFFKPREVKVGYSGTELHPSWFVEEVAKAAKPMLRVMVESYVKKNSGIIKQAMNDFLSTQNLTLLTGAAMRDATFKDIQDIATEVVRQMRSGV